jgi:hypothetical protein
VVGYGEHNNEPSGPMKGREYFSQVNDYQLPKKDSASCSQLP